MSSLPPTPQSALSTHPVLRQTRIATAIIALLGATCSHAQTAQPSEPASDGDRRATLETVTVMGRQQSGKYFDGRANGASKSDIPLREVPQAVRVIPRQLLDDLGAQRLDDVLDYVAGVSRQNNFGGTWDNVAMRGFAGHEDSGMSLLRNGMSANRGFNAPRDTANLESLEFLKGTMGALYGITEPGGTVNLVTKQPRFAASHAIETYFGSYNYKRLAVDSTGPLNGDAETPATLAYRLNVSIEDKDSFRDHVRSRREMVAPALTWNVAPDTVIRYDGEWLRQRAPLDRGVVMVNGSADTVPISRFYGEPGDGDIKIVNQTHQWFLEHALSADWQARAGVQYKRGTLEGRSSEGHVYSRRDENGTDLDRCGTSLESEGLLCRRARFRDFVSEDHSVQFDLLGKLHTASLRHELVIGAEAFRFKLDQRLTQQAASNRRDYGINVFNPVYGQSSTPLTATATNQDQTQRGLAVYAQDQIELHPQWKLLLGLRHDRYRQNIENRADGTGTEQSPSATTPRIGMTWLASPEVSLYASLGRSFRPNLGLDAQGNDFEPEVGTASELGLKWQSANQRLGGSLAVYDITKRNVLKSVAGSDRAAAVDEVRNKGLEAEMMGWVARGWRVALSYAYLDSELKQFPRHSASAFIVHEMPLAEGRLLGLGGGATHVSKRIGDFGEPVLPAYTIAKLTGYMRINSALRVSLDVDNLFDRTYYTSAYNRAWVTPGSPRTATLGLQAKF